MAQKCSICTHPKRRPIERMMLNPKHSERGIAKHFGVSAAALGRHKKHIVRAVTTAKRAGVVTAGRSALEQFEEMMEEAETRYRAATGTVQVSWFREWREMLELAFKLGLAAREAEADRGYKDVSPAVAAMIEAITARAKEDDVVDATRGA